LTCRANDYADADAAAKRVNDDLEERRMFRFHLATIAKYRQLMADEITALDEIYLRSVEDACFKRDEKRLQQALDGKGCCERCGRPPFSCVAWLCVPVEPPGDLLADDGGAA
jgi:hypothetical protein